MSSVVRCCLITVLVCAGLFCFASGEGTPEQVFRTPLVFVPNAGQTAPPARFVSHVAKYQLFLTSDGATLAWPAGNDRKFALQMKWTGARQPKIVGEQRLPGVSSFFIGNNRNQWLSNVPQFARVHYQDLYPGTNWELYGNDGRLEHDLVFEPGADVTLPQLEFRGASGLSVRPDGALVVHTAAGDLIQARPRIYQIVDGRRRPISGGYSLVGDNRVAFRVGRYDHHRALVIDPVLFYSTLLGGNGSDSANGVAVDSSGHAFVVGTTQSTNFPETPGFSHTGGEDAFVTKFNASGTGIIYSAQIGGPADDEGNAIAVDGSGNAYITGGTNSGNQFPDQNGGVGSVFAVKLNATGSAIVYATEFGGISGNRDAQHGAAIKVDSTGAAYIGGFAGRETTFPVATTVIGDAGGDNAFAVKLDPTGVAFNYATIIGGDGSDNLFGLDIDSSGNAYVAGVTQGTTFPTTPGAFETQRRGVADGWAAKLNASGTTLIYSTLLGGSGFDFANAIAVDPLGNAHVVGYTSSTDFPTKLIFQGGFPHCHLNSLGDCSGDAFFTYLNGDGTGVFLSSYLGGSGGDMATSVAINPVDNSGTGFYGTYIGGSTTSTDFPTGNSAFQRVFGGGGATGDGFFARFSNVFVGGSYLGASRNDSVNGIAFQGTAAYLVGGTISSNFPVTPGAFQQRLAPGTSGQDTNDAFVAKAIGGCTLNGTDKSVTLCRPSSGAKVSSPVLIEAGTIDNFNRVKQMQIYVDHVKAYQANLSALYVHIPMLPGTHRVSVQAVDVANNVFLKTIYITVN